MAAKRVIVAMSGGVDSSVTAALLKDRGFAVIGITLQIWQPFGGEGACCGINSITDARKVADQLGLAHYVLNFRDIFKEKVIVDFCAEYQAGRTPNPCIRCNQYIKFTALLERARQLDAAYIATGHYARIEFNRQKGKFLLKKGRDAKKDQSYVLYTMTQAQLQHTLLPLGDFTKEEVRKMAHDRDLPIADKPESQEICFIPDNNYRQFLKERFPESARPGNILNQEGKVIGRHAGIIAYTVGQRQRIGIADKQPLYVTSIDLAANTIRVGKREDVYRDELLADKVNFIYLDKLKAPLEVEAKVRYLHPAAKAIVSPHDRNKVRVKFSQPQFAVTPGQAVVFYQRDVVIGGGTIR